MVVGEVGGVFGVLYKVEVSPHDGVNVVGNLEEFFEVSCSLGMYIGASGEVEVDESEGQIAAGFVSAREADALYVSFQAILRLLNDLVVVLVVGADHNDGTSTLFCVIVVQDAPPW